MGLGLADLSTAQVHSSYPPLAVAVAIMGAGMGLVMAPASTTIMNSVPSQQAGAGSAINDTIREVGGALGIAVIGSISAAAYAARLGTTLAAAHTPAALSARRDRLGRRRGRAEPASGRRRRGATGRRRARRVRARDEPGAAGGRGRRPRVRDRRRVRAAGPPGQRDQQAAAATAAAVERTAADEPVLAAAAGSRPAA